MAEKEVQMLGTKDIADKLKVDPKYLRQVLRSLDKYNDNGHTRYEWKPGDPFLEKLPKIVADYKAEHERKAKEKDKTEAKPKAKAKPKSKLPPKKKKSKAAAAGASTSAPAPEPAEETEAAEIT